MLERLGWYSTDAKQPAAADTQSRLWVHAASVGEVFTVLPLVREWLRNTSNGQVLLTTGTPTAALVLEQQALPNVLHQYLPVDFRGACQRFVKQARVQQAWIVETEIWPWLYAICDRADIELTIVNGRLSERTSKQSTGLLASSYQRALANVRVLARSKEDKDRFVSLGASAANIQVAGNLKCAGDSDLSGSQSLVTQPYVLAASTHEDEELQLAMAWHPTRKKQALLVIAPRHPERGPAIAKQLTDAGLRVSLRSRGDSPAPTDDVYLADTLGELQTWYRFAAAAFVGGSLIERGGHNVLEPARYGCPVVVGPHTSNFDDMMTLMRGANAIECVDKADQATEFFMQALAGEQTVLAMGERARGVAEDSLRTMDRYLGLLSLSPDRSSTSVDARHA